MVSLLPARNAAADLPGHLESVARFADTVVALDDGSTDDTRAILEAHPLVHTVLTNPRREGYAGWDDSANRNRLLAAALGLAPAWEGPLDAGRPPAAAESALVSFCAAKAFRYRVDPQAGVTLLGTRFAHGLMGHRDALPGHTACPGNAAYPRMDAIRIGVAALLSELGGQPTASHTPPPIELPGYCAAKGP